MDTDLARKTDAAFAAEHQVVLNTLVQVDRIVYPARKRNSSGKLT